MHEDWTPASWRAAEIAQLPVYPDEAALAVVESRLAELPPLISFGGVRRLKSMLAEVAAGRAFLLQGGDCAETFADFHPDNARDTLRLIDRMTALLSETTEKPVVKLGRVAGQFAKPRSTLIEERDDARLPVWRGDIVNDIAFNSAARQPDPARMLRAYDQARATLDVLDQARRGADADIHASHEALLLPYEQALTRRDPLTGEWFATSAHFVWIGDRTRFAGSAHIEYARGIANPIGIKCGPNLQPDGLLRLLEILDPAREPGRLTLICRFGHDTVEKILPPLIRAVGRTGHPVIWSCDPMHGNTIRAANGYKTRPFESILAEVCGFFTVHNAEGTRSGGIHCEMTASDVTECTGGAVPVTERGLADRYHTHCDPRLNTAQAIELASLLAEMLNEEHGPGLSRAVPPGIRASA